MRLLYTLTAYPPYLGGAQLHQHILAQQLQKRHAIQSICHWQKNRTDWLLGTTLKAPSRKYDYEIDGIPVHRLGFSAWEKLQMAPFVAAYYPFMALALPAIARHFAHHLLPFAAKSDLIHNVRIGREGLTFASLQAARKYSIPFVLTPVHHPRWVGWRYREYLKLYIQADAVIALTQTEKQTLIQLGVREDRIAVTGIGPVLAPEANPENFLSAHTTLQEPFVLFLGQHYPYKGYRQLLESAPIVWEKYPEAHFVFIGPDVKQSNQAFENCDRRIHRLGSVDLQTKTDAIAACTMLCVPSTQESFGGVYTEAWCFNKPVIGCPIPAVAEVVTDGVDGYLVEQEPSKVAEAICHLLATPSLAESMGQAGHNKVKQRFTWEHLAQKTEQAYQSVLSGKTF
jgi:glycosyltransferase involved in cell wall biosynthesis